jgi:hypothetical protein
MGPIGILLTRDLIFTSKVIGTAQELGVQVLVARDKTSALEMIKSHQPRAVFIDLADEELTTPADLKAYLELGGPRVTFLAFGPHIAVDALATAQSVGCNQVMARSKFSSQLPELIRQLFSETDRPG